jgi:hypothetical protein
LKLAAKRIDGVEAGPRLIYPRTAVFVILQNRDSPATCSWDVLPPGVTDAIKYFSFNSLVAEASGCRTAITPLESVKLLILQVGEMEEMAKLGFYPYKVPYTDFWRPNRVLIVIRNLKSMGGEADPCPTFPLDLNAPGTFFAGQSQT